MEATPAAPRATIESLLQKHIETLTSSNNQRAQRNLERAARVDALETHAAELDARHEDLLARRKDLDARRTDLLDARREAFDARGHRLAQTQAILEEGYRLSVELVAVHAEHRALRERLGM